MKKSLLLCYCLSLTAVAFAQRKPEFGFVVKLGTYAFPTTKELLTQNNIVVFNKREIYQTLPGHLYTLGFWQSFALGNQFKVVGELLYQNSEIKSKHYFYYSYLNNVTVDASTTQRLVENRLSLPIKLFYTFDKNRKFSVSLGVGISHVFNYYSVIKDGSEAGVPKNTYIVKPSKAIGSPYTRFLSAGMHYRLNPKTTIGLEYLIDRTGSKNPNYPYGFLFCDCICECNEYPYLTRPNLNSFSVSLRHNILDKRAHELPQIRD